MRKIKWLKSYKGSIIGDITNAGAKSAENFVSQGYAEYVVDETAREGKKKLIEQAIKSDDLGQVKMAKKALKNEEKKQYIGDQIGKSISKFTDYFDLAEQLMELQPFYYDKAKIWWFWNKDEFKWEIIDEVDLMNVVDENVNGAPPIDNRFHHFCDVRRIHGIGLDADAVGPLFPEQGQGRIDSVRISRKNGNRASFVCQGQCNAAPDAMASP